MSFKKRASKSIALALVGITIVIPITNRVLAMDNTLNTIEFNLEQDTYENVVNLFKSMKGNQKSSGNVIMLAEGITIDINTETGDIKFIDENENIISTSNFYDNLNRIYAKEMQVENRATLVTSGGTRGTADDLYYKVERDTRDRIHIKNSKGTGLNYSKDKYNYDTGSTKKFITYTKRANTYINNIYDSATADYAVLLFATLGLSNPITAPIISSLLVGWGAPAYIVGRATDLYNNYKNYRDNVKLADAQYNIIKG